MTRSPTGAPKAVQVVAVLEKKGTSILKLEPARGALFDDPVKAASSVRVAGGPRLLDDEFDRVLIAVDLELDDPLAMS